MNMGMRDTSPVDSDLVSKVRDLERKACHDAKELEGIRATIMVNFGAEHGRRKHLASVDEDLGACEAMVSVFEQLVDPDNLQVKNRALYDPNFPETSSTLQRIQDAVKSAVTPPFFVNPKCRIRVVDPNGDIVLMDIPLEWPKEPADEAAE